MPYTKRIVCLANSTKHHPGRCIAGKEIFADGSYGGWIRPISGRPGAEVLPDEYKYDNYSAPRLLDIVEVPLLYPTPNGHQIENQVIDPSKRWRKHGSIGSDELPRLRDRPPKLWINNHQTDTREGLYNCLTSAEAATQTYSLALISTQKFFVLVSSKIWDGVSKRKYLTRFQYNGELYVLPLTDPMVTDMFSARNF
jgi:hypothetical protein